MKMIDSKLIEHNNREYRVEIGADIDTRYPWGEYDGHGVLRMGRSKDKRPGENLILADDRSYWFYDVQVTMVKAKAEHWGISGSTEGMTKGQIIAEAVRRDMEYCTEWLSGDRFWCIVEVTDTDTGESKCVGGVEYSVRGDNSYIDEIVNDCVYCLDYAREEAHVCAVNAMSV
jgi:hypothetical protein